MADLPLAGLHILLAMESDDLAEVIDYQLAARGAVLCHASVREAMSGVVELGHPDLIIAEYPEADGCCDQLSSFLHRAKGQAQAPAIVLTTAEDERRQTCEASGQAACLTMPFSLQDLLGCIAMALGCVSSDSENLPGEAADSQG